MSEITPKQYTAIQAVLTERTVRDAAKVAKVNERTMARWLKEDAFQRALQDAQNALVDAAVRNLTRLTENAIASLEDCLSNTEPSPVRLRAATVVLDRVLRYKELVELEKRLARLEGGEDGDVDEQNSEA